jgi:hypothetical protein
MKKLSLIVLILVSVFMTSVKLYADSPITSTSFYTAYRGSHSDFHTLLG